MRGHQAEPIASTCDSFTQSSGRSVPNSQSENAEICSTRRLASFDDVTVDQRKDLIMSPHLVTTKSVLELVSNRNVDRLTSPSVSKNNDVGIDRICESKAFSRPVLISVPYISAFIASTCCRFKRNGVNKQI